MRFVLIGLCLLGFYLLLSGSLDSAEWIAGCATAAAASCVAPRSVAGGVIPASVRVGGVLLRVLVSRPGGEIGTMADQSFPVTGAATQDAMRRALETLGQSLSPNGFAVSVGDESLRLHQLARQ